MKTRTKLSIPSSLKNINGGKVIWGFMLENTLFTEFEEHNHVIIETAFHQRKQKNTSCYIDVVDNHLPAPHKARVYFGVAQMHLRMPGTRYYVKRKVASMTSGLSSPFPVTSLPGSSVSSFASPFPTTPLVMPSPMSTASTATTFTSATSCSDIMYPQLDPNLVALFSEDMMLANSGNRTIGYNSNMCGQLFTPISNECIKNGVNDDVANTLDGAFAGIICGIVDLGYTENSLQPSTNFSLYAENYINDRNNNQVVLSGQDMTYVDGIYQYNHQQQIDDPMNTVVDYKCPYTFPTGAIDLLQDVNWLNDESLYIQSSSTFNSNISFQESVSWSDLDPLLVLNHASGDNGNINMTNLGYD